jgi:hypothetical protein
MKTPYADEVGGTGAQLLVPDSHEAEAAVVVRRPALERLEQSLGSPMTERLLCALVGDHRMRARDLPLDEASSP